MKELCSINLLRAPARNIHKYMLLSWNLNPNYFHKFFMETNSPHVYIHKNVPFEIWNNFDLGRNNIPMLDYFANWKMRIEQYMNTKFSTCHFLQRRWDDGGKIWVEYQVLCHHNSPLHSAQDEFQKYADVISIHPKSVDS